MKLNLSPSQLMPKPRKSRVNPISSYGVIIRDGSGTEMRKVPDFVQILKNMDTNRATINLPERYTFLPAQSVAYYDLLQQ